MSINEKAVLVKMSISQWYNHVTDKKVTEEVAIQHGIQGRTLNKYVKQILSRTALEVMRSIASDLRTYHNGKTMPWKENGVRILPAASFMEYQKNIALLRNNFELAVKTFIAEYPTWVKKAQTDMGSLFSADDYPTVDEVKDKFSLEVSIMPFPNEADFRVDINSTVMDELRATTAHQIRTALQDATNSVRHRVLERIELLHNALADPKKVFRDETFYAVLNVAADAEKLNLTDDADLTKLIFKVDFLNNYTPKILRMGLLQREAVSDRLKNILLSYPL